MRSLELFPFNARGFSATFFLLSILTVLMALLSPSLQSFTLLLDETSSTFSVARVVIPGSEVFIPRASQLRHIWRSPVWKFFSIEYICNL